jgi:hypothetical protein
MTSDRRNTPISQVGVNEDADDVEARNISSELKNSAPV